MTIGELIEKLRAFDIDAPVEIVDADTGMRITKIHIAEGECSLFGAEPKAGTVYLWGEYDEMFGAGT